MKNDVVLDGDDNYEQAVATFGLAWQVGAACRYADNGSAFATGHGARNFIRDYCDGCDVRQTCLEFAVMSEEEHGIWGGIGKPVDRRAAVWRILIEEIGG